MLDWCCRFDPGCRRGLRSFWWRRRCMFSRCCSGTSAAWSGRCFPAAISKLSLIHEFGIVVSAYSASPLPLWERHRPPSAAVLEKERRSAASATSHRRCDPGEVLRPVDRPRPLSPTLSHKGRGSALPLAQNSRFNFQTARNKEILKPSLRANGSRECAPDDRLCEAIHRAAQRKNGLLRRFAPRNDGKHTFATPPRDAPEALMNLSPMEGVGNAGCPLHPRPRVHFVLVERTRVTTSTPESPGIPARNGFNGFLRALPGDRAVLPPSPSGLRLCPRPVGPTKPPRTCRQRRGVRTTRLRRTLQHRSSARRLIAHGPFANPPCNHVARLTLPRPPHPHPASVTIAIRPSGGVGCESSRIDLG